VWDAFVAWDVMALPALQKFEQQIGRQMRLLEIRKNIIERKIERQIRLFEQKRDGIGKKIEAQIRQFEAKRGIRLDDEVRFIRSWIERPLSIGAVTPSGKILARVMAGYVDPNSSGPVVELGPGTGPVTEALVEAGVAPSRLVLVEFNPAFCRILQKRYPEATLVQGDAYSMRRLLETGKYPEAVFTATRFEPRGEGDGGEIQGDFTLHGTSRPLELQVTQTGPGKYQAVGSVVQSSYGIKPYSGFFGALKVRDAVAVEAEVELPAPGDV